MKRKTFILLAVPASVIGLLGGFLQGTLENRAALGEIATANAHWVEWTSRTPGPPTATPGPPATPMTLNCPPPTEEGYRVLCIVVEPEEAAALATTAAAGAALRATAEAQEPTP